MVMRLTVVLLAAVLWSGAAEQIDGLRGLRELGYETRYVDGAYEFTRPGCAGALQAAWSYGVVMCDADTDLYANTGAVLREMVCHRALCNVSQGAWLGRVLYVVAVDRGVLAIGGWGICQTSQGGPAPFIPAPTWQGWGGIAKNTPPLGNVIGSAPGPASKAARLNVDTDSSGASFGRNSYRNIPCAATQIAGMLAGSRWRPTSTTSCLSRVADPTVGKTCKPFATPATAQKLCATTEDLEECARGRGTRISGAFFIETAGDAHFTHPRNRGWGYPGGWVAL